MYKASIDFNGRELSLEAGKFAKFANGSVMVRCGDTMVLVTVTASSNELEGIDFLPLQVEYREKMAAAGKFPGGFLKREGRPSEKEILVARLIDRPIRPMIPKGWYHETQIVAQVFSAEKDVDPENIAALGASAALLISDIPFNGPIAEVRVGRLNGEFIANPTEEQLEECVIDITVAGTDSSVVMVEGESSEISESEFLEAIEFGHNQIKALNDLQKQLLAQTSKEKLTFEKKEVPEEIYTFIESTISKGLDEYVHKNTSKEERGENRRALKEQAQEAVNEKFAGNEEYEGKLDAYIGEVFSKLEKIYMRKMILDDKIRLDGRKLDEIRPIATEIGLLPRAHGSALFTRGETQSLTTATLGTSSDEQMIDGLLPTHTSKFYLHYNFPPFSVGETGRFGGTSRREIGHGKLAERALAKMMPSENFEYTVRVVSDILESNGSSSMATVCAGSMALMNAGVPLKKSVAGIAMGLIMEEDSYAILSDILGDEDFLGDMDFKVAGTRDGITACQMDIKIEGLSIELMKEALNQAHAGRMHILDKMAETIEEASEELSPYAPRFTSFKIPNDSIGLLIGPGGSTIREITAESNTDINIEDDGTVIIAATSQEDADTARAIIDKLMEKPEEGKVYTGKVKEVREGLGALIEFMPKQVGLLHISQIAWEKTENVADVITAGEEIEVKLLEIGRDGKFKLSRKVLLEKPEGYVEPEPRPRRDDRRGGRDDRRGGRGRDDRRGGRDRYDNRDRGPREDRDRNDGGNKNVSNDSSPQYPTDPDDTKGL